MVPTHFFVLVYFFKFKSYKIKIDYLRLNILKFLYKKKHSFVPPRKENSNSLEDYPEQNLFLRVFIGFDRI